MTCIEAQGIISWIGLLKVVNRFYSFTTFSCGLKFYNALKENYKFKTNANENVLDLLFEEHVRKFNKKKTKVIEIKYSPVSCYELNEIECVL